jgi:hypothetical protein
VAQRQLDRIREFCQERSKGATISGLAVEVELLSQASDEAHMRRSDFAPARFENSCERTELTKRYGVLVSIGLGLDIRSRTISRANIERSATIVSQFDLANVTVVARGNC